MNSLETNSNRSNEIYHIYLTYLRKLFNDFIYQRLILPDTVLVRFLNIVYKLSYSSSQAFHHD